MAVRYIDPEEVTKGYERHEIARDDAGYPEALVRLGAPPLRIVGNPDALLSDPLVYVTGTRRATHCGIALAEASAEAVADVGATLINGDAIGCETYALRAAAHPMAEKFSHGHTSRAVAWVASGADRPYPPVNAETFADILAGGGCIVSAEPWGTAPMRHAFQSRQRYIAAVSSALVLCECGRRSGLQTLAENAECPVLAFPGSPFSQEARGCNALIAEGVARCVPDPRDLAYNLGKVQGLTENARLMGVVEPCHYPFDRKDGGDPILRELIASPMRPDDLAETLGVSALEVLRELASLEASGLVDRLPDGRYQANMRHLRAVEAPWYLDRASADVPRHGRRP